MRTKVLTLGLICIFIFAYCKKQLPTSPDILSIIHPKIEYFTANSESISRGESSTLSWSVKNATTITIDQGIGTVAEQDTTEVSPEETTTYTLVASTGSDSARASVQVDVLMPAQVDFHAYLEGTSGHDGMAMPPVVEGYMHTWGNVENTGGATATNIVLHIPLVDYFFQEVYHLEYLVCSRLEPEERVEFDYTLTLSLEIYFQIDVGKSWQQRYFTWDNN